MMRLLLLLPVTLVACTVRPHIGPERAASAPVAANVRSTSTPDLRGHWSVTNVNGRRASGLWLELGGEGVATVTTSGTAVYVGSPQPPTLAYLGCNWWEPSGWTREQDKLILGREMSRRTERGCDQPREALDDEAYGILTRPMTIQLTSPSRLRLISESGTIELVRDGAEDE